VPKKLAVTKDELDSIIKRRLSEGKSLAINKVVKEEAQGRAIKLAAHKYYGNWTNALIANGAEPNTRRDVSKEDVIAKIKRLQAEGHSLKTSEMDNWLYFGIKKHFGSWKKAKEELGIKTKHTYKKSEARKKADLAKVIWTRDKILNEFNKAINECDTRIELRKNYPKLISAITRQYGSLEDFANTEGFILPPKFIKQTKYTKEFVSQEIKRLHKEGVNISSNYLRNNGYKHVVEAAKRYYGTWNNALEANGIEPVVKIRQYNFSCKEDVAKQYLKDYKQGKRRDDIGYRTSVIKYFGNFDELEKYLGIYEEPHVYELIEKDELDNKIREIMSKESDYISYKVLDKYDKNIAYSIRKYYGNLKNYFTQLDIDYYAKPYVPFEWTPENVKRQLMRWIREGKPVNYTYVAYKHKGIIKAARKFYGNWENVFKACGLNYDDYRVDTTMASYYGKQLEDIVAKILDEIGVKYCREPEINGCHPDFVFNQRWIDVKLSEWTINLADCETVKKYEPHCKTLFIIFLRGDKTLYKPISEKTIMMNVYRFIEKLPIEKRKYFEDKLKRLEEELENVA
jgi:hypothetical protein